MSRGKFILIEGLDCSGKTTLQKELVNLMNNNDHKAMRKKEPTDSHVGKLIKKVINNEEKMDPDILQYLFFVDRFNNYTEILHGIIDIITTSTFSVVCDRGFLSNVTYQGINYYDTKEYMNKIIEIRDINLRLMEYVLKPDYVFYIDTPLGIIENRLRERRNRDIFENHDDLEKASKVFKDVIKLFNDSGLVNIHILDGTKSAKQLAEECYIMMRL